MLLIFAMLICSCGDRTTNENINSNQNENLALKPQQPAQINFPFEYIDSKKEIRNNDNSYNEMILYACGSKPNIDTLKMFCAIKKKEFTDGVFHIIVFFDKKNNAAFPNNPVTAFYTDEKPSKNIKAIYTFNRVNGYSKLDYYDKNYWESAAQQINIE